MQLYTRYLCERDKGGMNSIYLLSWDIFKSDQIQKKKIQKVWTVGKKTLAFKEDYLKVTDLIVSVLSNTSKNFIISQKIFLNRRYLKVLNWFLS